MYEQSRAARARWLAELDSELSEALRLVELASKVSGRSETLELILRIEAVRRKIRELQLKGLSRR